MDTNLFIEHQCPQCGAPADLKETDRIFSCEYCRVKSYLFSKDVFRHLLPTRAPKNKRLIYVPYWRFKGMLFSSLESGISHRFVDMSHSAVHSRYFPSSVGLRSQALKLRFASPETPGVFLSPGLSFDSVMKIFLKRVNASVQDRIFHQAHIGEALSLIYSPFYAENKLYDAVVNRPITSTLPEGFDIEREAGGSLDWRIQFLPTLCPDCGWDLSGERDALALVCGNCNTIWQPAKNGLVKIPFAHMPSGDGGIYMPFWNIRTDMTEIQLNSFADLVRVANLPKAVQNEWHRRAFSFWVPAFKIRPRTFLRLSQGMTLRQPEEMPQEHIPDGHLYSVTLPLIEAYESLKIILASFIKPKRTQLPLLSKIRLTPKSNRLVYIPFRERYLEIIQPKYQLTINKNQLALAGNL